MRIPGALGDSLITQALGIVKFRCRDEIPAAPKDFLITQPPRIVKSHLVDVKISPYEKRALRGALFGFSDI